MSCPFQLFSRKVKLTVINISKKISATNIVPHSKSIISGHNTYHSLYYKTKTKKVFINTKIKTKNKKVFLNTTNKKNKKKRKKDKNILDKKNKK
jgi:hypothetical protein